MSSDMFHIGYFLSGSGVHWSWQQDGVGNFGNAWMKPDFFIHVAKELERACVDYILLEDNSYVADRYGDSMDFYLRHGLGSPRQDPAVIASLLSQHTSSIGLVPTLGTFAYHPYTVARLIGTLDQVTGGRAGWNMVTGSSERAYQNYGEPGMPPHDQRYEIASEFCDAVNALCDTWEPGAIVADRDAGVLTDPAKVHRADFTGARFATRGPLNSGPLPQGRPVLAQAGSSPRGRQFAAGYADTIVASERSVEGMKRFRDDVRARMVALGRKPDDCKVLFVVSPILGRTEADAAARREELLADADASAELALATLSKTTDIDFGRFPLDEPLTADGLSTEGTQATLTEFVARNEGRTLRQAGAATWIANRGVLGLTGTPASVADRMIEMMAEVGGDGFLLGSSDLSRSGIAELTEGLIPALQKRGAVRTSYTHATLRENLLEF